MRPIRTLSLLLILGVSPLTAQAPVRAAPLSRQATAQPQAAGMSLKEARDSFAKADADKSGSLALEEAATSGLDSGAFAGADADADGKLDQDEFLVGAESRAAKLPAGAAADLTAESTRLQALRRAQKTEELRTRREVTAPGAARTGNRAGTSPASPGEPAAPADTSAPATTAPSGPAAARRALAPATPADQENPQDLRASIVRRLWTGELSPEKARELLEAIDRRLGTTPLEQPKTDAAPTPAGEAAGLVPSGPNHDLRAIEETLSRRIRKSEVDSDKAKELYDNTIRRVENARGAGSPQAPAAGATTAPPNPEGIRARIAEAQSDLTRRLRNAEVTPEQAALQQAALVKRLRNTVEGLKEGSQPTAGASGEPAAPPAPGGNTPAAADQSSPSVPNPARPRPESTVPTAPAAATPPVSLPARRASDPAAPVQPAPGAARGTTSAPTPPAQPASNPPAPSPVDGGPIKPAPPPAKPAPPPAKPARPAPPAAKPVSPPVSGGGKSA
ncbi:MAG TPA: hypothetical protein VK843_14350 [Planctomycetota bacterium]|nr:hypothetical protein [Planctomycetota bacterium]